jgi:phosphoribosylformimino-5-aminoimidazole carboxamide ribotide isomerase
MPAIDLLDGNPVQLQQGDFSRQSRHSLDAVDAACQLADWGASWIHIVDLDAARGSGDNRPLIAKIRAAVLSHLQVGGGIRVLQDAAELLAMGVDRLVVGSPLAADSELPSRWAARTQGHLVAGIDSENGRVKVRGWQDYAGVDDVVLASKLATQPLTGMVFTAIERDGMLTGPNLERTTAVAAAFQRPVLVSGGIATDADLHQVARLGTGIVGAIVGTAWYQGRVDLEALMRRYDQQEAGVQW